MGGLVGWGQLVWRDRLTCHFTYLRLTSRGLERRRRAGLRRAASSPMTRRISWSGA